MRTCSPRPASSGRARLLGATCSRSAQGARHRADAALHARRHADAAGALDRRFDAVLNLFTSFGFFAAPHDDARVIAEFARVLKPGGTLVWHGGNRDGVMARFLSRDWWHSRTTAR